MKYNITKGQLHEIKDLNIFREYGLSFRNISNEFNEKFITNPKLFEILNIKPEDCCIRGTGWEIKLDDEIFINGSHYLVDVLWEAFKHKLTEIKIQN